MTYWPLDSGRIVTSPFGPRGGGFHAGTDFGFPGGSADKPVYAPEGGRVIHAGAAQGYGGPDPAGWVVIAAAKEVWELGHIVGEVGRGDTVTAGQRVGRVNPDKRTNGGTAPHLHVSYMPGNYNPAQKIDPMPLLRGAKDPGGRRMGFTGDPVWLADVLRAALGDRLVVWDGWDKRGTGGVMRDIWGVMIHHTGNYGERPENIRDGVHQPSGWLAGPLSQCLFTPDGKCHLVAVGPCNHAGNGSYRGLGTNNANKRLIGFECAWPTLRPELPLGYDPNESWSTPLIISVRDATAAVIKELGHPVSRIIGHKEYAGASQGKIDPGNFSMDWFRGEVQKDLDGYRFPGETPTPSPAQPQPAPAPSEHDVATTWSPPSKPGDRQAEIIRAKAALARYSYGKGLGDTDEYTEAFGDALREYGPRVNDEIDKCRRGKPYVNTDGVFDWAMKVQLGVIDRAPSPTPTPSPTPAARPRHAWLVYRGTHGVVGEDYVSRVCQGAADLVEEVNPEFPASMGGLPPGAPDTPSAREAISIGVESGSRWIEQNATRTFGLGGYSLGELVAARLLESLFTPGARLYKHRERFVASFHIGPPARPVNAAYYKGTPAPGVGISSWRLSPEIALNLRHCWLCHPGDMYGAIPVPIPGGTGDIMETVYDTVTGSALNDPLGTLQHMIPHLLEIVQDAGVLPALAMGTGGGLLGGLLSGGSATAGGALLGGVADGAGSRPGGAPLSGLLAGGGGALVSVVLPLLIQTLPGLIAGVGGGVSNELTGPAAAAQAAVIGLKFLTTGTRDHINYHCDEVWPGQTFIGLGVQHVRHWASEVPVAA